MNKNMMWVLLFMTGCAVGSASPVAPVVVYKADFNIEQQPQMSLPEAYENIKHDLQTEKWGLDDIQVTSQGFSFVYMGNKYSGKFDEIQTLKVSDEPVNGSDNYCVYYTLDSSCICWTSPIDARSFVDAFMAMKYYSSRDLIADDAVVFADFQQKAKIWLTLSPKPPIPEEARRFRVLADDAVQNKDFDKAANFYEQGLAIDPMWPAGQFNAAIIYGELKFYPMAVMHMKRYLGLKPDAKDAKVCQDKLYIWEEKASDNESASGSSSGQSAQPTSSVSSAGVAQQILQNMVAK